MKNHKEMEEFLAIFDKKYWFQPAEDSGCCGLCEGGLAPWCRDHHESDCLIQVVHDFLENNHIPRFIGKRE